MMMENNKDNETVSPSSSEMSHHHHQQNPSAYYNNHHIQQLQQPQPVQQRPPVNEDFQKQIQQDWANREYIEVISGSIKRIADFLNSFDLSCRYRLALLNEKLTSLERKIEVLEAWISKGETLP